MDSSSCLAKVVSALAPMVPRPGPESVLAEDVRSALRRAGLIPEIEVTLTQGRVDLRVGATAIELKVQGATEKVLSQLSRYAEDPTITDVVLVTSSAKLRVMPAEIGGKPLHVIYLPRL